MKAPILLILSIVVLLSSCGPRVVTKITSTNDEVKVSTTMNVKDSTGVSVDVKPNVNIYPKN